MSLSETKLSTICQSLVEDGEYTVWTSTVSLAEVQPNLLLTKLCVSTLEREVWWSGDGDPCIPRDIFELEGLTCWCRTAVGSCCREVCSSSAILSEFRFAELKYPHVYYAQKSGKINTKANCRGCQYQSNVLLPQGVPFQEVAHRGLSKSASVSKMPSKQYAAQSEVNAFDGQSQNARCQCCGTKSAYPP